MKAAAALLLLPLACLAQQPHEREVQRALIELDRRSAEFSSHQPLAPHVGQPLHADPQVARQLRPYERMRLAEEHERMRLAEERDRVLRLPPPVVREGKSGSDPDFSPLPLPGGPEGVVDPVTLPGSRG